MPGSETKSLVKFDPSINELNLLFLLKLIRFVFKTSSISKFLLFFFDLYLSKIYDFNFIPNINSSKKYFYLRLIPLIFCSKKDIL